MSAKKILVSKEGYEKLQSDLEYLITVKRKEVSIALQKARAFGDLSENSEYDEAKNEQADVEGKIAHLEATIKNAKIIDDDQIRTDVIGVGCKVRIYDLTLEEECEYSIVGPTECDPFNNIISDESPLGKALLGARIGDNVSVETPAGIDKYNIISISKI